MSTFVAGDRLQKWMLLVIMTSIYFRIVLTEWLLRFNPQGKSPRNDAAEFNEKRVYRNWCIGRLGCNICRLGVCSNSSKFVGIIHFHEKQVTKDAETFHDYQSCCVWLFVRSYGAFTCSFLSPWSLGNCFLCVQPSKQVYQNCFSFDTRSYCFRTNARHCVHPEINPN